MTTVLERRLAEFVNRSDEMGVFTHILDTGDPPIMVVWGDGGVGKSYLLAKMIHECAQRDLCKAEVVWTDTRNHDYLAIMRKIRDDLGVKFFNPFTDLVNFYTVPQYELKVKVEGSISVAENAHIEGSTTGDIAGVIIKDLMIPEPRKDMAVPEDEKLARLTDKFIENFDLALKELAVEKPVIVLMDAVEKMSDDTRKWVFEEMFGSVRDGRLSNVRFVLCGRQEPPREIDRELQLIIEEAQLKPLEHEHIVEYLEKRGVPASNRDALATMLMVSTSGNPLHIANSVDAFLKMSQKRGR
jgi:GTPase SAR1 family protein